MVEQTEQPTIPSQQAQQPQVTEPQTTTPSQDLTISTPGVPESTPATTPPPQKKTSPVIFIILILILLLIGGGIFFFKKTQPSPVNQAKQQATESPTQSSQQHIQKTSTKVGWKTYTNQANKISFQYPSTLHLTESSPGMGVITAQLRSDNNLDTKYAANFQWLILPKFLAKTVGQDFDEYYAMENNSSKTISANKQSQILTKTDNRSISGLRAFDFTSTSNPPQSNQQATYGAYIEIGNNIFIISTQEQNKATLEQILATFTVEK